MGTATVVDAERYVTITLPRSHWRQIVGDIENMCGAPAHEIEILSKVSVLHDGEPKADDERR
jgi:hypothetical protein